MTIFTLKMVAFLSMVIDHTGVVFNLSSWFRVVGRLAFPLFVFMLAEGFWHTKNRVQFLTRLFVFAVISEPIFDMAFAGAATLWQVNFFARTNIFYTFFLGGLAITLWEKLKEYHDGSQMGNALACVVVAPCAVIANELGSDYGAYGVIFVFCMYLLRHLPKPVTLVGMLGFSLYQFDWVIDWALQHGVDTLAAHHWGFFVAVMVAVVIVAFYNGRRGPSWKWFFYVAYPAHLAVLVVIRML